MGPSEQEPSLFYLRMEINSRTEKPYSSILHFNKGTICSWSAFITLSLSVAASKLALGPVSLFLQYQPFLPQVSSGRICDSNISLPGIGKDRKVFEVYLYKDSSVGRATCYGVGGTEIESRWGRGFPHPSRPTLGPTQPPVQYQYQVFPGGKTAGTRRRTPTPSSAEVNERV